MSSMLATRQLCLSGVVTGAYTSGRFTFKYQSTLHGVF